MRQFPACSLLEKENSNSDLSSTPFPPCSPAPREQGSFFDALFSSHSCTVAGSIEHVLIISLRVSITISRYPFLHSSYPHTACPYKMFKAAVSCCECQSPGRPRTRSPHQTFPFSPFSVLCICFFPFKELPFRPTVTLLCPNPRRCCQICGRWRADREC